MDDADLDRLAELAACMGGSAAAELIARVLPRRDGEELPDLRNRLARAALRTPTGPTLVPDDGDVPIATWLERLPVADRVLLTLRYGEHLTVSEVARIIERPTPEIESRLTTLTRDVPAPAEADLTFGLARLAEAAPGPAELAHAVTHATRRRTRRRRAVAGVLALAATFALIVAVTVQIGQRSPDLAFANPGTWQVTHQVDPSPGWSVSGFSLTRDDETTRVRRGDHECEVRIEFWSPIEPWPEIKPPSRPVLLGPWRADLVGQTAIRLDGGGGRMTVGCPPEVGVEALIQLAQSVRFAARPIRVPLRVRELRRGRSSQASTSSAARPGSSSDGRTSRSRSPRARAGRTARRHRCRTPTRG